MATEKPANDLADYQPDREGAQHRHDRIGIESTDHCALEDEADESNHTRRNNDPQPQGQCAFVKEVNSVSAEENEFPMGEIENAHHAGDHSQTKHDEHHH